MKYSGPVAAPRRIGNERRVAAAERSPQEGAAAKWWRRETRGDASLSVSSAL